MARKHIDILSDQLKAAIGARLLVLRTHHGVSQAAFAAGIGIRQNAYQKWEAGQNFPDPMAILAIHRRFGVDFNFIFMGDFNGLSGNLAVELAKLLVAKSPDTEAPD